MLTDTFLSPPHRPGRATGRIRHHLLILYSARLSPACTTITLLQSDFSVLININKRQRWLDLLGRLELQLNSVQTYQQLNPEIRPLLELPVLRSQGAALGCLHLLQCGAHVQEQNDALGLTPHPGWKPLMRVNHSPGTAPVANYSSKRAWFMAGRALTPSAGYTWASLDLIIDFISELIRKKMLIPPWVHTARSDQGNFRG